MKYEIVLAQGEIPVPEDPEAVADEAHISEFPDVYDVSLGADNILLDTTKIQGSYTKSYTLWFIQNWDTPEILTYFNVASKSALETLFGNRMQALTGYNSGYILGNIIGVKSFVIIDPALKNIAGHIGFGSQDSTVNADFLWDKYSDLTIARIPNPFNTVFFDNFASLFTNCYTLQSARASGQYSTTRRRSYILDKVTQSVSKIDMYKPGASMDRTHTITKAFAEALWVDDENHMILASANVVSGIWKPKYSNPTIFSS